MADKVYYQDIGLANNLLENFRIENVATNPTPPTTPYPQWLGKTVYNTTDDTLYTFDGTNWNQAGAGDITDITLSGDVTSPTSTDGNVTTTVASVGGVTASAVATAVGQAHDQNTDTGTTSTSFIIDSGNVNGITLNNNGGTLEVNNVTNSALADIRVANLYVEGTITEIDSVTVTIGDNIIELNSNITDDALNSDGGIAIKRLQADDTTRADAVLQFNETSDRWETTFGDVTDLRTKEISLTHREIIGDATNTIFTITHNLDKETVNYSVRDTGTNEYVEPKRVSSTADTLTLEFKGITPAVGQFEILVTG